MSVPVHDESSPAPSSPSLSVVVATHRRPEGLGRLLAKLAPQTAGRTDREVIVVNDGSHDERYAKVVAAFDGITYEALAENVGVGEARNRGAARARHDYVVYTDDDCEPPDCWLDWLSALLRMHPEIDVVAGTTRPLWSGKRAFLERVQAHYNLLPHPWGMGSGRHIFVTANVAIRRSLLVRLNGFSALRMGEDTELSLRLARSGARSLIDPTWYVRHRVGDRMIDQMRRYAAYGCANVLLTRLPIASPVHTHFATATLRGLPRHVAQTWREEMRRSAGFSGNAAARLLSAAIATAVRSSHYFGCARGARLLRAERAASQRAAKPLSPAPR